MKTFIITCVVTWKYTDTFQPTSISQVTRLPPPLLLSSSKINKQNKQGEHLIPSYFMTKSFLTSGRKRLKMKPIFHIYPRNSFGDSIPRHSCVLPHHNSGYVNFFISPPWRNSLGESFYSALVSQHIWWKSIFFSLRHFFTTIFVHDFSCISLRLCSSWEREKSASIFFWLFAPAPTFLFSLATRRSSV